MISARKKKKIILFFALIATGWGFVQEQGIRLNGYAHYVFNDKIDSYYSRTSYYYGTINGGFQWGAGIEYQLSPDYGIELLYFRQDTDVPVSYYRNGPVSDVIDVGINRTDTGKLVGDVEFAAAAERASAAANPWG